MWLLVVTLSGASRTRKKQNVQFGEKRSTWKCFVGANFYAQVDKNFKENPDGKWVKGRGDLRATQKLLISEKELRKSLSS